MYRPPGIIENQRQLFERSDLPHKEKLWFCNPSNQIYVREHKEMPAIKAKDLNDQVINKIKEINNSMSLKANL